MSAIHVLDAVKSKLSLKNDAALCRVLQLHPPVVSKLRHFRLPMGATHILAIHEQAAMPVAEIRELLAKE